MSDQESPPQGVEGYDFILYLGFICFAGYEKLTDLIEARANKGTKAYLIIATGGGDPDAGYRIGRALGHYYHDDLKVFVPDVCKSAGTLVAIGANELVISDRGELGPLDVQYQKKEELFEMSSGLDILQSMQVLTGSVKAAFKDYLFDLKLTAGLGTKLAAQLASEMASNLVQPISAQIDPLKLGEHQRALGIATHYGRRLNEKFRNTTEGHIDELLAGYPAHSFVIDRKEASKLFSRVRAPEGTELAIEKVLRHGTNGFKGVHSLDPRVECLNEALSGGRHDQEVSRDPQAGGGSVPEQRSDRTTTDENAGEHGGGEQRSLEQGQGGRPAAPKAVGDS